MSERLPSWFVVVLVAALAIVVGFGTTGLVLAIVGAFAPLPTLALGAAATVALIRVVAPWTIPAARDRAAGVPAALAVALTTAAMAFGMEHHAEHVLVDRDPGVYVVAARWMAIHHNMEFDAGPFQHFYGLAFASPGVYSDGHGRLYFQFSHLLPALLAEARWVGGDHLMFLVPPILGGVGLLAFYALATRFVRPWIALAALAALATDLVEVHFTRDAYSELLTQIAVLGGLWLLTRPGPARPATAAFAGLVLGTTVMARIDGPLYLFAIPLALAGAAYARRRGSPEGGGAVRAAPWLAAGAVVPIAVGYLDVAIRSPKYAQSLGNRVPLEYVGLALVCVAGIAIATWLPRLVTLLARGRLPDAGGLFVGVALFAMWLLRPHLQQTTVPFGHFNAETDALQRFYGIVHGRVRTRDELTLVWHSWYLGPLTLAVGIVGVAYLTREVLRGRGGPTGLVVATFLPVAAVYLVNPNIYSDQIWAMRRFLPLVIPGFVLFAFVVADRLLGLHLGRATVAARAGAIVILVAAIAWPISTDLAVRNDTTQRGFSTAVERVCRLLGPNAAVLMLESVTDLEAPTNRLDEVAPQTIRSYCNVPVAIVWANSDEVLQMNRARAAYLSRKWRGMRRTLFLVADSRERIGQVFPGLEPVGTVVAVNSRLLPRTVKDRPRDLVTERYRFVVAAVPTSLAGATG